MVIIKWLNGKWRGDRRELRVRTRWADLSAVLYTGDNCDTAPATDKWRFVGWGTFTIGGAGVWLDCYPIDIVLSFEWRPYEVHDNGW